MSAVVNRSTRVRIWPWLALLGAVGVAMALIYPDSFQQDGGFHFLYARSAWKHPGMFVEVWPRPLFTFIYSFPAQLGYLPAKLLTVVITLITAWQTFRLAQQLHLERPTWVAPLLFLQPSYLMLSADTMTEPLFALILVAALRLHEMKKEFAGMAVASLLILARPEGFFIGVLWGIWILLDRSSVRTIWQRLPSTVILASGAFLWWLVALLLSGDAMFIRNNWPPEWGVISAADRAGSFWDYTHRLPNIAGPLLCAFLILGLVVALVRRRLGIVTAVFLSFFVLHSVFRSLGLFGSAGYARYFVCVAPAIALLTLNGWNQLAAWVQGVPRALQIAAAAIIFFLSGLAAVSYTDSTAYTRDARAVAEAVSWYHMHGRPFSKMIYSQAYMAILMDQDVGIRVRSGSNRTTNLEIFRNMPIGTLVFWDRDTGPSWYGVKADDLAAEGYTPLYSQSYVMNGWMNPRLRWWYHDWGPRKQEMHLLYKED
jgi:hypothetical protein